jgi:hypothetical protein
MCDSLTVLETLMEEGMTLHLRGDVVEIHVVEVLDFLMMILLMEGGALMDGAILLTAMTTPCGIGMQASSLLPKVTSIPDLKWLLSRLTTSKPSGPINSMFIML